MGCSTNALCKICQRHIQYFDESSRLAVEHRLVHEHDGKPPPQPVMKQKALYAGSPHTAESTASTNSAVAIQTTVGSRQSSQQPQQSAVADARSKFEQVLRASKEAAAAAGSIATTPVPVDRCIDKKLLTTGDSVAAPRCSEPEKGLMSSLLYDQLVFAALLNVTLQFYQPVKAVCHACGILCVYNRLFIAQQATRDIQA